MLRAAVFLLSVSLSLAAWGDPFPNANPAKGEKLAEQSCVSCHSARFGGDGSQIYTRPDHGIKNARQLLDRVTFCSQMAKTDWSKQEIADVAAYLNQQYYKFQ
jgi:mono/diheme cytochrome c family protein